jgi:hypothetical protein
LTPSCADAAAMLTTQNATLAIQRIDAKWYIND